MNRNPLPIPPPVTADGVRRWLSAYGLAPQKRLGQNFLIDSQVVQGILHAADCRAGDRFLEVGPGLGILTEALLRCGAKVLAIELDRGLHRLLQERLGHDPALTAIQGDALKLDWHQAAQQAWQAQPEKVAANLPYNITGPLVARLLKELPDVERWVFMVQEEVAERMLAAPGSKVYGAFTVFIHFYANPRKVLRVAPASFYPRPEVSSAVVCLEKRADLPSRDFCLDFERVVRTLFQSRRKTIRNGAAKMLDPEVNREKMLGDWGFDPQQRPETLSVEDFKRFTRMIRGERTI